MTKLHFELTSDFETIIAHSRGGKKMDIKEAVKELNDLEDIRIRLQKEKAMLREESYLHWDILDGIRAYLKLKYKMED